MFENQTKPETLLRRCNLKSCEGMCCYDGVYLKNGEETNIRTLINQYKEFFNFLPAQPLIDGNWMNLVKGRKTAVQPHEYRNPNFPEHFNRTRCVFAFPDARCSLQVLAEQLGKHPWSFKPMACWLHPLRVYNQELVPPSVRQIDDKDRLDENYPGYITFTDCGRHVKDGLLWNEVLAEEIAYYHNIFHQE